MKDKPILMTGEMVRATLAGRKTQTRRIVKPQPPSNQGIYFKAPYQVGDMLWVRETHRILYGIIRKDGHNAVSYAEEFSAVELSNMKTTTKRGKCPPWKSSIYMPKWACRLWLEIVSVRVERLQDISAEDCMAEGTYLLGVRELWDSINAKPKLCKHNPYTYVKEVCYVGYPFDNIRTKRTLPSGIKEYIVGNPMVWAIGFKRIEK